MRIASRRDSLDYIIKDILFIAQSHVCLKALVSLTILP